jgi:response regulator RpfG family c-di-GMP phosphodiesterase
MDTAYMLTLPISRKQRETRKVLLVEAPSAARDRHAKTLAKNGYEVITTDSPQLAWPHWVADRFGLVLVELNGYAEEAARLCSEIKSADPDQVIALVFHPDQELPATDCPTLIFTTEPDEYFLARVETLTQAVRAA